MDSTVCKRCKREWSIDSEQAAAIRLYGQCIVCCVELERTENYEWSISEVQAERLKAA